MLRLYLEEMRRVSLLSPDEERLLTQSIHRLASDVRREVLRSPFGKARLAFLLEGMNRPPLRPEELPVSGLRPVLNRAQALDETLAQLTRMPPGRRRDERLAALQGLVLENLEDFRDRAARLRGLVGRYDEAVSTMVHANLRLVVAFTRPYRFAGMPVTDLIQEGNSGLLKAVERFDPARGLRFSTYATWWIRQAVLRAVSEKSRLVRLPAHTQAAITRLKSASRTALGDPSLEEAAREAGISLEEARRYLVTIRPTLSLDRPVRTSGEASGADSLLDRTVKSRADASADAAAERVERLLARLPPRDREILCLRFGLAGRPVRTLEEVGKSLHITREWVRQLERRALRRLREWTRQAES